MQDMVDGIPLTGIATILQFSPQSFFTRVELGINTPADFAGYRIAVTADSTRIALEGLLQIAGLSLDDVEIVEVDFDMTPFYDGEVDIWVGYTTNEVVRARQQGLELVTFPLYEYGIESVGEAIFTSQTLLETQPELVQGFIRATLRGWNWSIENPEQAIDAMLEQFPELADERNFHLDSFNAYIPLVRQPGVAVGTIDCERWLSNEAFADLDTTEGLCTSDIFEQARLDN